MTRRAFLGLGAARKGITLVEILISILIMGVGMLSLATLFPLGLERIRRASRASRSALLTESAGDQVASRNLLLKDGFLGTWYPLYDPFTRDPANPLNPSAFFQDTGIDRLHPYSGLPQTSPVSVMGGTGIPICYDPLWWYQLFLTRGITPISQLGLANTPGARFGNGMGLVGIGGKDADGGAVSAWGLQRLTNIPVINGVMLDPGPISASPDDIVMQVDGNANPAKGLGSSVVNDLSTGQTLSDLSYTWMFTGKQTDVDNGMVFDGDIVLFQNRPFALDSSASGTPVVAGETVVEAIWGYGVGSAANSTSYPYSVNNTSVLLRWNGALQADPDVRVGGWIADVTYEKFAQTEATRWYGQAGWSNYYPAQRCYWYQVVKRSDPTPDHQNNAGYREMVVTLATPVRARTPMLSNSTSNANTNVALICPSVVNVVPRVFYTR